MITNNYIVLLDRFDLKGKQIDFKITGVFSTPEKAKELVDERLNCKNIEWLSLGDILNTKEFNRDDKKYKISIIIMEVDEYYE